MATNKSRGSMYFILGVIFLFFMLKGKSSLSGQEESVVGSESILSFSDYDFSNAHGGSSLSYLFAFTSPENDCSVASNQPTTNFVATDGLTSKEKPAVLGLQCSVGQYVDSYECQNGETREKCLSDGERLFSEYWKKGASSDQLFLQNYAHTNTRTVYYTYVCMECGGTSADDASSAIPVFALAAFIGFLTVRRKK